MFWAKKILGRTKIVSSFTIPNKHFSSILLPVTFEEHYITSFFFFLHFMKCVKFEYVSRKLYEFCAVCVFTKIPIKHMSMFLNKIFQTYILPFILIHRQELKFKKKRKLLIQPNNLKKSFTPYSRLVFFIL